MKKSDPAQKPVPERRDVWKMFDRVAHRYDLLNRTLSFGRDVRWRRHLAQLLPPRNELEVLDLATGTGDLLLSLYTDSGRVVSGVGLDMAGRMLEIARAKVRDRGLSDRLALIRADASTIPFMSASFDAVTIAFGIRNVVDVPQALSEMHRVLKPGGRCLILEFSLPRNRIIRAAYLFYFRYLLPRIGAIVSGDNYAYSYLNETVETFPYGQQFCDLMEDAGFEAVRGHTLTFGVATIYEGTKTA